MEWLVSAIVSLIITSIAFFIISKIPFIGVESDSIQKTVQAAAVFGILNAVFGILFSIPVLSQLLWLLTLGTLLVNLILFGLSAKIVEGFRLRNGIISAILGSIALTIALSVVRHVFAILV